MIHVIYTRNRDGEKTVEVYLDAAEAEVRFQQHKSAGHRVGVLVIPEPTDEILDRDRATGETA